MSSHTYLVLEGSLAGLIVASVAFVLDDVGEVADCADDCLPRTGELDAAELSTVLDQGGKVGLGSLEIRLAVRWDDGVGDLLVNVLAATDELGVLDATLDVPFSPSGLGAVENGLE